MNGYEYGWMEKYSYRYETKPCCMSHMSNKISKALWITGVHYYYLGYVPLEWSSK